MASLIASVSSQDASMPLLWLAAIASVGLAATTLWWTARLLIHDQETAAAKAVPEAPGAVPTAAVDAASHPEAPPVGVPAD